jgi:hypothetical protein
VPDWLEFLLIFLLWTPVLVLLHELGHAFAALLLTDGEVTIEMRAGGFDGGSATYDGERLRRPHDAAWIAAAGPAVSLAAACMLWFAWVKTQGASVAFAGAWIASGHFLGSVLPIYYGAGLNGSRESDGRVIWRLLTGAPPGGIERELRRMSEPEPAVRPVFAVLLGIVGVLAIAVDPVMGLALVGLFGGGALLQRRG